MRGSQRQPRPARSVVPTLRHEKRLLREGGHTLLAGMDEVGRGSLGGPVSVGVVVVDVATRTAPAGLRDSKLLTPDARQRLAPRLRRWALGWGVGHASAAEIDAVGILPALRLAGERALAALPVVPDLVLLDGNHDYLTRRDDGATLFPVEQVAVQQVGPCPPTLPVTTMVKGDLRCAAVAAASVLAKTTRDALMVELAREHPAYGWAENKGYASPAHLAALRELGPCVQHRRSWNLRVLAERALAEADAADELVLADELELETA